MTSKPILFTTIKVQDGKLISPCEHLEKLKTDYATLNQKKLNISTDDLVHFLKFYGRLDGTWRFNVFAASPIRFKLSIEKAPLINTCSLKQYPLPFYEPLAHFKKEDFSKRKRLLLKAYKEGAHDWIFTDEKGHILETTICNLFWIQNKTLFTPSDTLPLYFGTTLQKIMIAVETLGYRVEKVKEKSIEPLLKSFVFVTNSMKEVLPVSQIEKHEISINWKLVQELRWKTVDLKPLQNAHSSIH